MLRERDLNMANALDIVKRIKETIKDVKSLPTVQSNEVSQRVPTIGQKQRRKVILCFTLWDIFFKKNYLFLSWEKIFSKSLHCFNAELQYHKSDVKLGLWDILIFN